jgi:PAS domain S-box-containing protein
MKILIVDDNAEDRTILRHYLNRFAGEILEASDGAEGLVIARSGRPDLIISDALMPNVDGFEFLREIRRSTDLCDIHFIFYSAVYTGSRDQELAMALGADAFLVKPLEPEDFLSQLKNLLDGLNGSEKREMNELLAEDEKYLRKYSQMVAARLEEKVRELAMANRELAASEARYRNLFNSMRDVIIIADQNRIILDANQPALREMFGYETAEIVGKRSDVIYGSHEAFEMMGKEFFDLKNHPEAKLLEVEFSRKNGDRFTAELNALKLLDNFGNPVGNVGLIRDVTEHRKLEAQLRHAQRMESIGTLAGGVAHDFNNILTGIIGYGSLALMKMAADDPQRINIQNMLEASDRAVHLTKELLMFSRKQLIDRRPADLNMVVAKVQKFLKRVIGEDIEIKTMLHGGELTVLADVYQLEQVLMNLATNARDSMPNGGTVTVSTGIVSLDAGFTTAHGYGKPGRYALIIVSDTGGGMDKETLQRIFEPFFTTKDVGKGTGLGLAVVYGIIKQHDGHINVYSEPGHGTTFRIYLPLIEPETVEKTSRQREESPARGTETILLAEDNELVRDLAKSVLTEFGYTVIEAVDGEDAVRKFREHADSIQLLLFDMVMPILSGKEARDEIRKIKPGIKTIFASGYAPDIVRQKLAEEDGIQLISKPMSPTELLQKVRSVLDGTT